MLRWVKRRPAAILAAFYLVAVATACFLGPFLMDPALAEPSPQSHLAPSLNHPFGTDLNGRDLLYRTLAGGRISLVVGIAGALVSLAIGCSYGIAAGYAGGSIDQGMMRVVDVLYSVPRLIFILVFINAFNKSLQDFAVAQGWTWLAFYSRITILILSLGLIEWLTMARIVRGQVLSLKTRQFVLAARALGQSHSRIVLLHVLPNLLGIVIIYMTLTVPAVIIDESFLSFLGLGIQAPHASWGSLIADGAAAINPLKSNWWTLLFPASMMVSTLLALNVVGDALRDELDPRG